MAAVILKENYEAHEVTEPITRPRSCAPQAALYFENGLYFIAGSLNGWNGPRHSNPNLAIKAWNGLMGCAKVRALLTSHFTYVQMTILSDRGLASLHPQCLAPETVQDGRTGTRKKAWRVTQHSGQDGRVSWIGPRADSPEAARWRWRVLVDAFRRDHEALVDDPWPSMISVTEVPEETSTEVWDLTEDEVKVDTSEAFREAVKVDSSETFSDFPLKPARLEEAKVERLYQLPGPNDVGEGEEDLGAAVHEPFTPEIETGVSGLREDKEPPIKRVVKKSAGKFGRRVFTRTKPYEINTEMFPVPVGSGGGRLCEWVRMYPFDKMTKGQSFDVDLTEEGAATNASNAVYSCNKRNKKEKRKARFTLRRLSKNLMRVWRSE